MKYYYRLAFNLLFVLFSFSVVLPNLISSKDDFLFTAGILYLVFVVPSVLYYLNINAIKEFIAKKG